MVLSWCFGAVGGVKSVRQKLVGVKVSGEKLPGIEILWCKRVSGCCGSTAGYPVSPCRNACHIAARMLPCDLQYEKKTSFQFRSKIFFLARQYGA